MYLEDKPETEYTSHEHYVAQLKKQGEMAQFFPVNRALGLTTSDLQDEAEADREELRAALNDISARMDLVLGQLAQARESGFGFGE